MSGLVESCPMVLPSPLVCSRRTTEALFQLRKCGGPVVFMTALELRLPQAMLFSGHFGNPEAVRDAKSSPAHLAHGDVCRNHAFPVAFRQTREDLALAADDLRFTHIRRRERIGLSWP